MSANPSPSEYATNVFLSINIKSSSPYIKKPSSIAAVHSSMTYHGTAGELPDVLVCSVPRKEWPTVKQDIMAALSRTGAVTGVEVQEPKHRFKRDEF